MLDIDINAPIDVLISALLREYYEEYFKKERNQYYVENNYSPDDVANMCKKDYELYLQQKGIVIKNERKSS